MIALLLPIKLYCIEVTEFALSDWEIYKRLRLEAVKELPHAFGTSYREELNVTESDWKRRLGLNMLCAKKDDKIVGMVGAVIEKEEKKGHVAKIISLYVPPEARKLGAGDALIKTMIEKLQKTGVIQKIVLEVSVDQKPAIALYKKYGFHVTGFLENAYQIDGKSYDMYMMTLFLPICSTNNDLKYVNTNKRGLPSS